jgi:mannose-6-phosphate isomerase-like protein (cupin superfamily)
MRTIKIILRIVAGLIGAVGLYVIFSIVIGEYVFAQAPIQFNDYFRPGDRLASRFEGFYQTVISVNGDWMHTRLEIRPHAEGPPEHFHEGFTENFTVKSGTLSVMVNGEKQTVRAGETVSVPPLTPHRPFNETDEVVVIESEDPRSIPTKFGYVLSQLYGLMDEYPNGPSTRNIVLQLSVYGNDADTWIANGPPLNVQKAMRVMMAPTARLLGYRNYYPQYRPQH